MIKAFYYLFGIISTIYVFVVLFNVYAPEFIDEYWLDILYTKYAQEWYYGNLTISALTTLCAAIWIFNLGKNFNSKEKEPLLINKEEENE